MSSTITIRLRDFEALTRIGIHPWERDPEKPSRLLVNVALELSLADYYGKAGGYLNYDPLHAYLASWAERPHTDYLEHLAHDLVSFVFDSTPAERCIVSVEKPDVFADVDRVGVSYDVTRADWVTLMKLRANA
jgi:dihydroneopterin aldolase